VSATHPDLFLPPTGPWLAAERRAAADRGDDDATLWLRELELATEALPPMIDGVRRARLLAVDPLATTWEAWRIDDGLRVVLRCLRARWRDDPVMRRRFELAPSRVRHLHALELRTGGDWPHIRVVAPGAPLLDRLPVEDAADGRVLARLLGAGLDGLRRLHDADLRHGGPIGALLHEGPSGARLLWLDPFDRRRTVAQDLSGLATAVAALDPTGAHPVGALALAWTTDPPPSAAVGLRLLRETLASTLLEQRHRLRIAARLAGRRGRTRRLTAATRALDRTLPPPRVHTCVRAAPDGVLVLVHSDGAVLRGGSSASASPDALPVVWTARRGLDAQAARVLLRAWATRGTGDEALRGLVQADLGTTDAATDQLLRWLRSRASLRRARLLLEHQARF